MKIGRDIEIIDGLPMIHIKSLDAIACSDLHLGYEGVMAGRGTFLPKINFRKISGAITLAVKSSGAKRVIIDGDIKNEFSDLHIEESNEFHEFMKLMESLGIDDTILIKGNHDNFVDRFRGSMRFRIHSQEALLGDYLFFHGEELPIETKGKMLIMGHVHPAIALYNKLGVKEKLKCFLRGKLKDGREIMVLPAMNYFAEGVGVNTEDVSEMAPVFRDMLDINSMRALCIGEGETLDFGTIKELSNL